MYALGGSWRHLVCVGSVLSLWCVDCNRILKDTMFSANMCDPLSTASSLLALKFKSFRLEQ